MAIFAVTYEYGPDTERRMAARPAHRAWPVSYTHLTLPTKA